MLQIKKARRGNRKLRLAVDGPTGGGKTYTLLRLAHAMLARGMCKKILVIDTENESASLYVDENPDGVPFDFETIKLTNFAPTEYVAAIEISVRSGYDCIIIDSLSHAWIGEGGALDMVDKRSSNGNSFTAWKDITPLQRKMVDTIINCPAHVMVTMRSKVEYVLMDEVNRAGKSIKVPKKIGMAPVQRDGLEYEFDIYGSMDMEMIKISKSRCSPMQGASCPRPGAAFWHPLLDWMEGAKTTDIEDKVIHSDARTPEDRADAIGAAEYVKRIESASTDAEITQIGREVKDRKFSPSVMEPIIDAGKKRRAELAAEAANTEPTTV